MRAPSLSASRTPLRQSSGRFATGRTAAPRSEVRHTRKEERYQRLALVVTGAVVAVVVLLLGAGWYQTYVSPYRQTVLVVGNRNVTMDYFVKRVKAILPQYTVGNTSPDTLPPLVTNAARDQIEEDLVVLQRASQQGVTASPAEIDAQIAKNLNVPTDKNGQPSDRNAFEAAIRTHLQQSGYSLTEYREQVEAQTLRSKIQEKLTAALPAQGPQLKYSEIMTNTAADAQKILTRLKNGEDWDTVSADVRSAPNLGAVAGVDFEPPQQMDEKLANVLLALQPGQNTDVIKTTDGKFLIARLVDKQQNRQITDDQRKQLAPKLYTDWLDGQKKSIKIVDKLNDQSRLFAFLHSGYQPSTQQSLPFGSGAPVTGPAPNVSFSPNAPSTGAGAPGQAPAVPPPAAPPAPAGGPPGSAPPAP